MRVGLAPAGEIRLRNTCPARGLGILVGAIFLHGHHRIYLFASMGHGCITCHWYRVSVDTSCKENMAARTTSTALPTLPFLPIRALRLVLEFVPCVVITKVEAGIVRVCAIEKRDGVAAVPSTSFPKSIKKKGETIVGRIDLGRASLSGASQYKFAVWMGPRHGWVIAPDSETDDHVLISKISDDQFKVNCRYSHTVYTWDGSGFQATTIRHPSTTWKPFCPFWYAVTAIHDRNRLLDYFKCGPDTFLINMPPRSFALFNIKTGTMQEMMSHTDPPTEFMFIMGAISESQFLVSTYHDPHTYHPQPHNEHVSILTISQDAYGNPLPSFSLLRTPLQIRRMRAVQTFLIHHLSDYNIFVGDSDGCTCLITLHPAQNVLSIHYQSRPIATAAATSLWSFDVHQIPLPEDDEFDYDKISVSHNRIHLFTGAKVLYSDFRLDPPRHTSFVELDSPLPSGLLDVEISNRHGILDWVVEEIEAVKEQRRSCSK